MKTLATMITLAAVAAGMALADEASGTQAKDGLPAEDGISSGSATITVGSGSAMSTGGGTFVFRIGSDGKIQMTPFLPADVEAKVNEARDASQQKGTEAVERLEKQMKNGQGGREPVFGMQGTITIIGPDGVKHTQKFGNLGNGSDAVPNVQELLEKSLEAAGAALPADISGKLKQALQQQEQPPMPAGGSPPAGEASDISRKLDRILDRLEKLEQDVREMKVPGAKQ